MVEINRQTKLEWIIFDKLFDMLKNKKDASNLQSTVYHSYVPPILLSKTNVDFHLKLMHILKNKAKELWSGGVY